MANEHEPMNITVQNVRPGLDFKNIIKHIPEFDGSQNMPISAFIAACERLRNLIPAGEENTAVELLKYKCKGEAGLRIWYTPIHTLNDFIKFLSTHFRDRKSVTQHIVEFTAFRQQPNEKIIDFNFRIGRHLEETLWRIELEDWTVEQKQIKITTVKALAIEFFVNGIFDAYKLFMPRRVFQSLKDAVEAAQETEDRHNFSAIHRLNCLPISADCYPIQNPSHPAVPQNQLLTPSIPKECLFCGKIGHDANNCYALKAKANASKSQTSIASVVCNYCKKKGHLIKDCRKRAYNETRRSGNSGATNSGNARQLPPPSGVEGSQ